MIHVQQAPQSYISKCCRYFQVFCIAKNWNLQYQQSVRIIQLRSGDKPKPPNKIYAEMNRRLDNLRTEYEENTANAMHDTSMMPDTLEFLAAASHLLASAEKKKSKIAKKKASRRSLKQMHAFDVALDNNEVVLCKFNIAVTIEDMSILCPGRMLNDHLINIYLELIADRSKHDAVLPQVSVFHTQFFEKLSSKGVSSVAKWTKTMDIFQSDIVLIPIHHAFHWSLVVVKVSKQRLVYYDSLHGDGSRYISQIKEFLQVESAHKGYKGLDPTNWLAFMDKTIAMQENSYDYGLFLCRFAEIAPRLSQVNCAQKDMALEVAAGALKKY
uniref:Ubiquitin-like protease family profile domain-containing protein n=1 Tax=Ditylenchus dipsaci TaxID=166011 RepID=A0A915DU32_9BILA